MHYVVSGGYRPHGGSTRDERCSRTKYGIIGGHVMDSLISIIAEHPIFSGLQNRYLDLLVGCASNVRFDAGKHLFQEGEEATKCYLIRSGSVALQIDLPPKGLVTTQTFGEGDVIGWSWLFPPYRWHADALSTQLTRALALDGKCLRTKCEQDHDLGYELMTRFAILMERNLQSMRLQLLDVYSET